MEVIPEALVEETRDEIDSISISEIKRYMKRIGKGQPYLLAFVLGTTQDLRPGAHELANWLFVVIHRMFEKAKGKIRRVQPQKIDAAYERNMAFIGRFQDAHERFLEGAAKMMSAAQPFVMKYLVEAVIEAPEEDDPVELSEDEQGQLFLTLKTVIDLLDESVEAV